MPKYLVETYYTCTFKIIHKLDELNEKKLSNLENSKDGKFEIIDVKLNNRKTKTLNNENLDTSSIKPETKHASDIASIVNEKISTPDELQNLNDFERKNIQSQR